MTQWVQKAINYNKRGYSGRERKSGPVLGKAHGGTQKFYPHESRKYWRSSPAGPSLPNPRQPWHMEKITKTGKKTRDPISELADKAKKKKKKVFLIRDQEEEDTRAGRKPSLDTGAAFSVFPFPPGPLNSLTKTVMGVDGKPPNWNLTKPLHIRWAIGKGPSYILSCSVPLLGRDLLCHLQTRVTWGKLETNNFV